MIVIENLDQIAAQLKTERTIEPDLLIEAIQQALVSAYCRRYGSNDTIEAIVDVQTGEARIFSMKTVVDTVENPDEHISCQQARENGVSDTVGDHVKLDVTPDAFGRVAVQAAKQVILQRIRESEKTNIYDKFKSKIGQLINGVVQRIEGSNYLINLGDVEAILDRREQIAGETLALGEHIRLILLNLKMTNRGPQLYVSRACPEMLIELFKREVPEIQDGVIELKSVARESGRRAKIAVLSHNDNVGAVGTCVGHMGSRIQNVLKELGSEKIDILEWHEDQAQFISNAMKPATVSRVVLTNAADRTATVVVPPDQLSLAIGKKGINVRLAVRLTQWKLDIISEDNYDGVQDDMVPNKTVTSLEDRILKDVDKEKGISPQSLAEHIQAELASEDDPQDSPDDTATSVSGQLSQLAHMYDFELDAFITVLESHGISVSRTEELKTDQLDAINAIFKNIKTQATDAPSDTTATSSDSDNESDTTATSSDSDNESDTA